MVSINTRKMRGRILGAAWVVIAATTLAGSQSWNTGSGTWDDVTTNNWSLGRVPVSGDSVTINRGADTTVDFASAFFASAGSNLLGLTLGGTGASNVLQVGAGDTLNFTNSVTIANGGRLDMSGGTISDVAPTNSWHDALKINNGGSVRLTGGVFMIPMQANCYLADTSNHTASLEVKGNAMLTNTAPPSSGGDLMAQRGNSMLTLADNGVIHIVRDVLVGTISGNHMWSISGGTLRSTFANGSTGGMRFGGGAGSVTVTQTAGIVSSTSFYLAGGATYNLSGGTNFVSNTIYLADVAGQSAALNMSGGTLTNGSYDLLARSGNSTLNLSNGEINIKRTISLGTGGGTHNWTISGGTLITRANSEPTDGVGATNGVGTVTINQTGGLVKFNILNMFGTATYSLQNATMTNGTVYCDGIFTQTSGVHYVANDLVFGSAGGRTGVYTMVGGTLRSRGLDVGPAGGGAGIFTMIGGALSVNAGEGNSGSYDFFRVGPTNGVGSGTFTIKGGSVSGPFRSLYLNNGGVIRGYGDILSITYTAPIVMQGRVIADGEGVDQNLTLGGMLNTVTNPVDNVSSQGWFATNHGKLILPPVPVAAATTNVYNWGEQKNDAMIDLVNSARFEFTGLSGSGSLTGAVMAIDRPDASPVSKNGVSTHEFTMTGATFSKYTLTLRYDDVATRGHDDQLALFRWTGTTWDRLTVSIDMANHWVTATNLTTLGRFNLSLVPRGSLLSVQ